jgi:cytochrome c biogenesis protein CcmG/thiol:disulfide interchange protein DsbE
MSETVQSAAYERAEAPSTPFHISSVILWAVVLGVLALLGWGLVNSQATRPEAGEVAPAFSMQYFDGYEWENRPTADLSDFRGQVVVLNFWASWCVECRVEAAHLESSWRKYRDQGVVFLGITYADVEPNALQYLLDYDVTYPNAPDLGTVISEDYEITGVPETFFIDKSGVISHVQLGPVNERQLNGLIEELLKQEDV